jgi:hypothetical protein
VIIDVLRRLAKFIVLEVTVFFLIVCVDAILLRRVSVRFVEGVEEDKVAFLRRYFLAQPHVSIRRFSLHNV